MKETLPLSPLRVAVISCIISTGTVLLLFRLATANPAIREFMSPSPTQTASSTSGMPNTIGASGKTTTRPEEETTISVVKKTQPAIVAVRILSDVVQRPQIQFDPFGFGDPFSPFMMPQPQQPTEPQKKEKVEIGGGSGFFVSEDGIIATNRHVVDTAGAEFEVQTVDGKKYPAKILGKDPALDVAFLKVEGSHFPTLEFGDPDGLQPGQSVIAIGNALNEFRNSVTKGIVSGLNRHITANDGGSSEAIEGAIQTDAAINPGNSGGPLLDLNGRVVGLNTAVSVRGQLIGFAIPSTIVKRSLESIQKNGHIVRPLLGVRYQIVTEELAKNNQLPVTYGAIVLRGTDQTALAVMPGSPADKAGINENDIILEVNGEKITEDHTLATVIATKQPGDKLTLKILHKGEEKTMEVTLAEMK